MRFIQRVKNDTEWDREFASRAARPTRSP